MTQPLNPTVEIKVLDARLNEWGLPAYQSEMAAAIDLHACVDTPVSIAPGTPAQLVPAGIAVHMGNPYMAATIVPRSGLGHKKGLVPGERIAQMMFVPVLRPVFTTVDEFSEDSERGAGGFGSTGVHHAKVSA
ncbi:Deoxyuridine 5'-triphosphate nucleotidohydrolase [compost metagenome]